MQPLDKKEKSPAVYTIMKFNFAFPEVKLQS
jgi:hypothetical protein